jgi:hypothetical protein
LKLATEESAKKKIDWVLISSNLFGTVMIHRVINEQVSKGRGQFFLTAFFAPRG